MKKIILLYCISIITSLSMVNAQTITTIATGLNNPIGICRDSSGHIFIAESGTGNNDAKICMIDSAGNKHTVIYGLPSFMDTATHQITGAWRPYVSDSMLTVIVGEGPDTVAGTIMMFSMDSINSNGDSLTISDTINTIFIQPWVHSQGYPESDVYSAVWDSMGNIYAVDAGANAVLKIDSMENISILDTFPAIPNTFTPFPPAIDYVPTKIISDMNGAFYVCNLTGFPFIPGISEIKMIDTMGTMTTFAQGLSQAVDMEMDSMNNIYVLQFGTFDTSGAPIAGSASIVMVSPGGAIDTIASGFGPSAGMAMDSAGGFYVTELVSGNLLHIENIGTGLNNRNKNISSFTYYPNPATEVLNIKFLLKKSSKVKYTILDNLGRILYSEQETAEGLINKIIDLRMFDSGIYYVTVNAGNYSKTIPLIKY